MMSVLSEGLSAIILNMLYKLLAAYIHSDKFTVNYLPIGSKDACLMFLNTFCTFK